jgi:hypothetical protein
MKIAIIEDRLRRLEQFNGLDLRSHKSVKIITGVDFDNFIVEIGKGNMKILDDFACISSHRSALSNSIRDTIKDYCKLKNKPLIFFSGGVTSSVYDDRDFPFLHINAKDFYSSNLTMFLDDLVRSQRTNLLMFQFGRRWKLSMLLSLRNRISVYLNKIEIERRYRTVELDDSEIISSISDLRINSELIKDLVTDDKCQFLKGNEFAIITHDQLIELRNYVKKVIIETV